MGAHETLAILTAGLVISLVLTYVGILISRRKRYGLLPGYRRASEDLRTQYDAQGLANHIGNGLITLAILLSISVILLYLAFSTAAIVFIGLFLFIAFIIVVGSPKFMPAQQARAASSSVPVADHAFLHWLLPEKAFRAIEAGTRQWVQECGTCGHIQDFWDAGGVRYKACGEPRKLMFCQSCQKLHMHKIRKKTPAEANEAVTGNG